MATITNRKIKYNRPHLYKKQEQAIFNDSRYSFVEASTKSGKTVGCITWILEQALAADEGMNFWWVAPVYSVSKIAYRRLKRYLPNSVYQSNETELTISLVNGAVIWFKGGDKPDTLYGEDVYAVVIDEASRCKEEVWHAVRSTLTYTQGKARLIGNVRGRKNWFYALCRKAEAGRKGMEHHKIDAYDAIDGGVLDPAEIEDAKDVLPDHVFRELYMAEASDDGGNPFGLQFISACLVPGLSNAPVQAWGWDLAKQMDWTVGIGLDKEGVTASFERFQKDWTYTINRIWTVTNGVRAIVDSTGVGDPIVEFLQKNRPDKDRVTIEWKDGQFVATGTRKQKLSSTNFEGYYLNPASKQQLIEHLVVGIQHQEVRFPDGVIRQELDSFEYEITRTGVKYTAPEGMHDDCVVSLALSYWGLTHGVPVADIF